MTKRIFRVPVDEEHFDLTIGGNRSIGQVRPFLTSKELPVFEAIDEFDGIDLHLWGSKPKENTIRVFKQMQNNDEIVFYRKGKYVAVATIYCPTVNPNLAVNTWGRDAQDGLTWELIYFLDDVRFLTVDFKLPKSQWGVDAKVLHSAWGYKPIGLLRGLQKVSDEKAQPFLEKYGSVAQFLREQKIVLI